MELKISIVTCSDTRDLAQDEAGAALEELIEAQGWTVVSHVVAEAIRAYSMTKTRRAMLSRAVCMQRGHTLVINFPGSTKAARESWEAVSDQLEHAAQMTAGGGHTK